MEERYSGLEVLRTRDEDVFFVQCGTVVSQKTLSSRVYFFFLKSLGFWNHPVSGHIRQGARPRSCTGPLNVFL